MFELVVLPFKVLAFLLLLPFRILGFVVLLPLKILVFVLFLFLLVLAIPVAFLLLPFVLLALPYFCLSECVSWFSVERLGVSRSGSILVSIAC